MVLEERLEQPEDEAAIAAATPREIAPVENEEPVPPPGISEDEAQELRSRAEGLIKDLEAVAGGREMELINGITNIGTHAQRKAGSELDLLRGRVSDMVAREGAVAKVTKDLVELRVGLNEINPNELRKRGLVRLALSLVPFVGKLTDDLRVLERIAVRYEPISRQVNVIADRLRGGRIMLTQDNVELRQLYEHVEAQQLPIQKNAYLGELLIQQMSELMERTDDVPKADRLRNVLHDVSMRVQDLRTMEAVHAQFFVSIEMSRQSNTRMAQSVERTLTLAINVVTVGLAIQTALARQKRVLEATQRTRDFLGEVIVSNAAAIKQHTEAIGDVYNSPVIAIDRISQAHSDLIEAMDTADRLKQAGIDSARENIVKLGQMSAELDRRASGLAAPAASEAPSVEA